jgi:hypothetical protein
VEFWLSGFIPPFYAEPLFELHKINKTGFSFLRSLSARPRLIFAILIDLRSSQDGTKTTARENEKCLRVFGPQISLQANNDAALGRIKSEMQRELWPEFVVHYALSRPLSSPARTKGEILSDINPAKGQHTALSPKLRRSRAPHKKPPSNLHFK